jgi:hypothetical protein
LTVQKEKHTLEIEMSVASQFRWDGKPPLRFVSSSVNGPHRSVRATPQNATGSPLARGKEISGAAAHYLPVLAEVDIEVLAGDEDPSYSQGGGGRQKHHGGHHHAMPHSGFLIQFDTTGIEADVHRAWLCGKREDIALFCGHYNDRLRELTEEEEAAQRGVANGVRSPSREAAVDEKQNGAPSAMSEAIESIAHRHAAVLEKRRSRQ